MLILSHNSNNPKIVDTLVDIARPIFLNDIAYKLVSYLFVYPKKCRNSPHNCRSMIIF